MDLFPDVKLRIVSGFSGHVQDWLLRGKIDLGVAYEGQKSPSIKTQPIIIEQLFLIQSANGADHLDGVPITIGDALSQPLILPNPEHGLRGRIESIAATVGQVLQVMLEIDILPTMIAFVERGLGSTILPLVSVRDHMQAGRLIARPIIDRPIDRTLVLMTPLNRPDLAADEQLCRLRDTRGSGYGECRSLAGNKALDPSQRHRPRHTDPPDRKNGQAIGPVPDQPDSCRRTSDDGRADNQSGDEGR